MPRRLEPLARYAPPRSGSRAAPARALAAAAQAPIDAAQRCGRRRKAVTRNAPTLSASNRRQCAGCAGRTARAGRVSRSSERGCVLARARDPNAADAAHHAAASRSRNQSGIMRRCAARGSLKASARAVQIASRCTKRSRGTKRLVRTNRLARSNRVERLGEASTPPRHAFRKRFGTFASALPRFEAVLAASRNRSSPTHGPDFSCEPELAKTMSDCARRIVEAHRRQHDPKSPAVSCSRTPPTTLANMSCPRA